MSGAAVGWKEGYWMDEWMDGQRGGRKVMEGRTGKI